MARCLRGWVTAAALVLLLALVPVSLVGRAEAQQAATADEIQVLEVDLERHPRVGIRLFLPPALPADAAPAFTVEEDGRSLPAEAQPIPASDQAVALVVDTAPSLRGPLLQQVRASAARFVRRLDAEVEVALVTVDGQPAVAHALGADREGVLESLASLSGGGEPAALDALGVAAGALEESERRSRNVVLVTVETDDVGTRTPDSVAEQLRREGAALEVLALPAASQGAPLRGVLGVVGGRLWELDSRAGLPEAYDGVLSRLQREHLLTYESKAAGRTELVIRADAGGGAAVGRRAVVLPSSAADADPGSSPQPSPAAAPVPAPVTPAEDDGRPLSAVWILALALLPVLLAAAWIATHRRRVPAVAAVDIRARLGAPKAPGGSDARAAGPATPAPTSGEAARKPARAGAAAITTEPAARLRERPEPAEPPREAGRPLKQAVRRARRAESRPASAQAVEPAGSAGRLVPAGLRRGALGRPAVPSDGATVPPAEPPGTPEPPEVPELSAAREPVEVPEAAAASEPVQEPEPAVAPPPSAQADPAPSPEPLAPPGPAAPPEPAEASEPAAPPGPAAPSQPAAPPESAAPPEPAAAPAADGELDALVGVLQGKTVQRAWAPVGDIRPLATDLLAGQSVSSVSGSGDDVLVRFAPTGVVLSVDLGPTGAWRLVPAGTSWRRLPGTPCFALEVEGWTAVCSDAVRCRLLARSQAPPSRPGA